MPAMLFTALGVVVAAILALAVASVRVGGRRQGGSRVDTVWIPCAPAPAPLVAAGPSPAELYAVRASAFRRALAEKGKTLEDLRIE